MVILKQYATLWVGCVLMLINMPMTNVAYGEEATIEGLWTMTIESEIMSCQHKPLKEDYYLKPSYHSYYPLSFPFYIHHKDDEYRVSVSGRDIVQLESGTRMSYNGPLAKRFLEFNGEGTPKHLYFKARISGSLEPLSFGNLDGDRIIDKMLNGDEIVIRASVTDNVMTGTFLVVQYALKNTCMTFYRLEATRN